jgi:hypothetical protein
LRSVIVQSLDSLLGAASNPLPFAKAFSVDDAVSLVPWGDAPGFNKMNKDPALKFDEHYLWD